MKNILTFDIEEWFHANYCDISSPDSCKDSNFRANMEKILELCSDNNCKATFFVLGCIGENYRDIVRMISDEGHDVASHGYCHELAYNQTREEFIEDVKKSVTILEDVIGKRVFGYRAPSWSIIERNLHYLEALEEIGLKYDASVFPVKTFLYGIPDACKTVHKPTIDGRELELYEIPTSVFSIMGKNLGYSGGFYFRVLPYPFIKKFIERSNKGNIPAVVYLHPREIDKSEQRLKLPLKESFIHYYNIKGTHGKLEKTMKKFEFTSVRNFLEEQYKVNFLK